MNDMGFAPHLVRLLENLYKDQEAAVRIDRETSEWFSVGKGVRQGCILSLYLFNVYTENIMRRVRHDPQRYRDPENKDFDFFSSLNVGGRKYPELRYADDTVLLLTTHGGLKEIIRSVKTYSEEQNFYLNANKTKIMKTDKTQTKIDIKIENDTIQEIEEFKYLGSIISNNGDINKEIQRRMAIALQKTRQMRKLWHGPDKNTKIRFLKALIFPIATYGCESWTINKTSERKINAFELKCYRTILKVNCTEKRTNNSILQELNIKEGWLLSTIIKRKLKYFGHVKRHEGLEKEILEGQVQGKRTRGRPRRRWSQDITERMTTTITRTGRIAQDRTTYREAVIDATCHKGYAT